MMHRSLVILCACAHALMHQGFAPRGSRLLASAAARQGRATALAVRGAAARRCQTTALAACGAGAELRKAVPLLVRGGAKGWTAALAAKSVALFVLSGLAEIGGGWLVWRHVREGAHWRNSVFGSLLLAAYGFIVTQQPPAAGEAFGRLDAAYGGVFIAMSFAWGRFVDGVYLDNGDRIGAALCLAGVAVITGWRRD